MHRVMAIALLLLVPGACRDQTDPAPGEAKPAAPQAKPKAAAAGTPGPGERLGGKVGASIVKTAFPLSPEEMQATGAKALHAYRSGKPDLTLVFFSYEDAQGAATGLPKVVAWLNRTRLLSHVSGMAEGDTVLVVGNQTGERLGEEAKRLTNRFLDAFTAGL